MAGPQFSPGDRVVDLKRFRVGTVVLAGADFEACLVRFDGLLVNRWVSWERLGLATVDYRAAIVERFRRGVSIPALYAEYGRELVDSVLRRMT